MVPFLTKILSQNHWARKVDTYVKASDTKTYKFKIIQIMAPGDKMEP